VPGELPGPIHEVLRTSVDDGQVERIRAAVAAQSDTLPKRRRARVLLAVALSLFALCVVAASLIWLREPGQERSSSSPARLHLTDGTLPSRLALQSSEQESRRYHFDDGSSIELGPGTEVAVQENDTRQVGLRLERGQATFEVAHVAGRRWIVYTGLVTVEVTGTVFTVTRNDELVRVMVARGRVVARSEHVEGGERALAMGEALELRWPVQTAEVLDGGSDQVARSLSSDGSDAEPPPMRSWREAARDGDWAGAYRALGQAGLRQRARGADTMAELLELADVARRSGHPAEAVGPLERATSEFSSDRRAAVAAFTLGRIEADDLRRDERAVQAFRRCIALGPPGALRDDAWARLAETYARSGQFERARSTAREYLERFPDGRHAQELRRWVDR